MLKWLGTVVGTLSSVLRRQPLRSWSFSNNPHSSSGASLGTRIITIVRGSILIDCPLRSSRFKVGVTV